MLGHSSYYPRYGYQTNTYGLCKVEIDAEKLPEASVKLDARPVQPADVPWLLERLEAELADVDFGWLRGTTLEGRRWSGIDSLVWCDGDGRRVAYMMRAARQRDKLVMLLAENPQMARETIYTLHRARSNTIRRAGWRTIHSIRLGRRPR